ncbi:unnamed protein product [Echinostoma caproni]|uniref:Chorein_N domain-containing protein n=1 Tax=Echinostoma caproni TaxID=27848 RepID=A0A183BBL3_9TREM|nr:unnamed protein product [Echinostoma caproni]
MEWQVAKVVALVRDLATEVSRRSASVRDLELHLQLESGVCFSAFALPR